MMQNVQMVIFLFLSFLCLPILSTRITVCKMNLFCRYEKYVELSFTITFIPLLGFLIQPTEFIANKLSRKLNRILISISYLNLQQFVKSVSIRLSALGKEIN